MDIIDKHLETGQFIYDVSQYCAAKGAITTYDYICNYKTDNTIKCNILNMYLDTGDDTITGRKYNLLGFIIQYGHCNIHQCFTARSILNGTVFHI